ncbi:hypothetical protein JFT91_25480 [Pseudomonas sp. TH08]|uniref:hypothetical protein n=1 Tax=unclassified Pseudomonas TaxID=196821 RepID=UPI0019142AC8|nr:MULTISPECIES: hypothetical protein [unclassified Pseudomonas]MBK5525498.1 hypothetical protein [Pseudomonas sp. TH06]MBK5535888.1 hypothetical protein [Pseudomonas sp. TH08]
MSEFKDKSITEGTRKKTDYDNDQKSRLALSVDRIDGGKLQIPIMVDAKTTEELDKYQQNTLLAITPLARLPGHDKLNETLQGGVPRVGRVYVFQNNKVWRELVTDGKGQLSEVDLVHWRKLADKKGNADKREPVGVKQQLILVPMFLQGRFVGRQFSMAFSEVSWTWEYITWLEEDPSRIKARSQNMASAWAAAAGETTIWKATSIHPATPIKKLTKGLRSRDFSIEAAMEDPAEFTPDFAAFKPDALILKLQKRKEELAQKIKLAPPPALPVLEAGEDLLAQKALRDYPQLIGMILDDPLYEVRHATAQIRECVDYLQTLNALVPHQQHGRYAQVLYSTLAGPLADLKDKVDLPKLESVVFEGERKKCREKLAARLLGLINATDSKLHTVLLDWCHRNDEGLLEPYSLMTEIIEALNQLPNRCDAMYTGQGYKELTASSNRICQAILKGEHPLGSLLLAKSSEQLPDTVKRLIKLRDRAQLPDPTLIGLSTLILTSGLTGAVDQPSAGKSFVYFLADLFDNFGASVVAQISRLSQDASKIQLDRIFTPTFSTLSALLPKISTIKLMQQGQALAQDYVIIGVQGAGLRRGLTESERQALTRKSYRYATLHNQSGEVIGSTSPRITRSSQPSLRDLTVIAIPKNHPDLANYSAFRVQMSSTTKVLDKNKAVPTLMVAFATYNLWAQIKAYKDLNASNESLRGGAGIASATLDLSAALGSHSKLLLGSTMELKLTKPRFDVAKISTSWARNLKNQTGSSKLPLLRSIGGIATLGGAVLGGWDSYRSFSQGDTDAAAAYGVVAVGSGLWGAYGLGLVVNPYILLAGVVMTIGGTIAANIFTDSDTEIIVKKGPFGVQFAETGMLDTLIGKHDIFTHLKDQKIAYQQLLGIIGRPQIFVERLSEWRKKAPTAHRLALQNADTNRSKKANSALECVIPEKQMLDDNDWAVVLSSPLLSMFENDKKFRLIAQEFQTRLEKSGLLSVKRYNRVPAASPKISALPLDATSVLYILSPSLPVMHLTPLQRYSFEMTEGLKISAQFELSVSETDESLVLPQPSPKKWIPFTIRDRQTPPDNISPEDAPPYWQIEIIESKV